MSKKLAIKILVQDDVSGGDTPDIAIVEITPELAARIRQLNRAVRKLKVLHIEEFDSTPDLYSGDLGDDPFRVLTDDDEVSMDVTSWDDTGTCDVVCLVVGDTEFHWAGMIKHTSIHWETEMIDIKEIGI